MKDLEIILITTIVGMTIFICLSTCMRVKENILILFTKNLPVTLKMKIGERIRESRMATKTSYIVS